MSMEKKFQVVFTEEEKRNLSAYLKGIEEILKDKVIQLTPEDCQYYGKLGAKTVGWAKEMYQDVDNNQFLVPPFVNFQEWSVDEEAREILTNCEVSLTNLLQQVEDTNKRVGFDIVEACHSMYQHVRLMSIKNMPGFKAFFEKWKKHYIRRKTKSPSDSSSTTM